MAIDPKDLTIDYRKIQSMPFRDRKALVYSSFADQVNSALTPSQRANLFPNYYVKSATSGATPGAGGDPNLSKADYLNRARNGGVSDSDLNRVSGRPEERDPPQITASEFRAVESNPFLAGYVDKTRRVETSNSKFGRFSPRERATLDFISAREGSKNPDIIFGDSGNKPGSGRYSRALGLDKRPLSDHSIAEVIALQKKLTAITGADGVARGVGTSAVGTGQMIRGTLIGNLRSLGIPEEDWDKIKFDETLQNRLTLENFKTSGIGDPNGDPRQWNHTTLGRQYESLDTSKGFNAMSGDEMYSIIKASSERPKEVDEQTATPDAMAVVQGVASDMPMAAELKPQTQTAVAEGGATGFYSELRNTYPDQIDKNSPLWDQVDPELKKSASAIIDADTGLVGRDALLAADAAAKVLRTNGMIPRVAEGGGGNNHSQNHGRGKSANYSIDLAASVQTESGIKPLKVGSGISPEIKAQMALAARLSSENSSGNFRVGIPLKDSSASMHIQVDPQLSATAWGYSESAKSAGVNSSIRALQRTEEGQSYLKQLENVSAMQPEEKSKLLASMTGIKEKETTTTVASTAVEVEKKAEDLKTTVESTATPTPDVTTVAPAQDVTTSGVTTAAVPPASESTNYPIKTMAQGGIIPKSADTQIVQRNMSGDIISATKVGENENERMNIEPISKMSADALTVGSYNPVEGGMNDSKSQSAPEDKKVSMTSRSVAQPRLSSDPYSNIQGNIKPMSPTARAAMMAARDLSTQRRGYSL